MSFFQNLFAAEFIGNWVLGDRQHSPSFKCPRNAGRSDEYVVAWNQGPYDLSGNDSDGNTSADLNIVFALSQGDYKNWATITIDVAAGAASSSAVTAIEIATALNADAQFAGFFDAIIEKFPGGGDRLEIKQKKPVAEMKFYIDNGNAEEAIRFNARAGIGELPWYFNRHTIANRHNFEDSTNLLIFLDAGVLNVHDAIIDNAVNAQGQSRGFSSSTVRADWELLEGRSGILQFTKNTYTGSDLTEQIIYSAGAKEGDLAKRIVRTYTGGAVDEVFELPHVLVTGDLITP